MNVVRSSRSSALPKTKVGGAAPASKINLYQEFPKMEVSLDDFEEFGLHRLQVGVLATLVLFSQVVEVEVHPFCVVNF